MLFNYQFITIYSRLSNLVQTLFIPSLLLNLFPHKKEVGVEVSLFSSLIIILINKMGFQDSMTFYFFVRILSVGNNTEINALIWKKNDKLEK